MENKNGLELLRVFEERAYWKGEGWKSGKMEGGGQRLEDWKREKMGKKLPNPSILPIPFFHSYSDSVLFQDIPIDFNAQAGGLGQGEMAFYWMNRGFSEVGAKPVFCHIAFKQWGDEI